MNLVILLPGATALSPSSSRSPCSTNGGSGARHSSSSGRSAWSSSLSARAARRSPGAAGWNELLYRTWYFSGAICTAGWLGLGTAFLLGRTRFGYTYAVLLLMAGVFTLLTQRKYDYEGPARRPCST